MLVNSYYLKREQYFWLKLLSVKYLFTLVIGLIIFSCTNKNQKFEKSFSGDLTLTPAESALLVFDRFVELQNDSAKRSKAKSELKSCDLINKHNTLALFVNNSKVDAAKRFIQINQEKLLFDGTSEFAWKTGNKESLLFIKDNRKSLEVGELVLSVVKSDSLISVQFAPNSKEVLSGFAMKHLNRPILLEIDDQLITTVKSFGKMENGLLEIKL